MDLTPQQERINRALDEALDGAELAEFQAFLEEDQEITDLYTQLHAVDATLHDPPAVAPSVDFASKVMAQIEAGEYVKYAPQDHRRWRLWLGLFATFVLVPLLLIAAVAVPLAANPDALLNLMQGVVPALGAVSGYMEGLLTFLSRLIATYPMAPALSLTVIPTAMLWVWLVWFLQSRNQTPTFIVPVQVAA